MLLKFRLHAQQKLAQLSTDFQARSLTTLGAWSPIRPTDRITGGDKIIRFGGFRTCETFTLKIMLFFFRQSSVKRAFQQMLDMESLWYLGFNRAPS